MRVLSNRPARGLGRRRANTLMLGVISALALSGAVASSASAFSWWTGTPSEPKMLAEGAKLPINSGGTAKSPFTIKWRRDFEVRCSGVTYKSLFLEGPVFMGAEGIVFEECVAKKPKHATLVGGKIETSALSGEIRPAGANVEFVFSPVSGNLASFTLKQTGVKPKHKRKKAHDRECTYTVSATGSLSGTLGDATKISTEKSFEFASNHLLLSQKRSCVEPPAAARAARVKRSRPQVERASSTSVVLKTAAGKLASSTPLKATSSNFVLATSLGKIECEETELAGSLISNGSPRDAAVLSEGFAKGDFESIPGACKTSLGPALAEISGFPLNATFTNKKVLEVSGSAPIVVTATFLALPEGENKCTFEGPKANELFNIGKTGHPEPVTITVVKLVFAHNASAPDQAASCPPSAILGGSFKLSSAGETVESEAGGNEAAEEEAEKEEHAEEVLEEKEEEEEVASEGNKGNLGYSATEGWGVL